LTSEEYASFSEDASELNTRLDSQASANELVVADLATANAQVAELTTQLATATALAESRATELTIITAERDVFKGHYDKAAAKGTSTADRDENSHGKVEVASYNANALEVFHKAHGK